ncbi:MAG TPA: plastocyanin/azurin family copper-binding protein [Planctomycetota bacterium]|nr:plastocyanin/azurin family copper-binding protein [Planctomycetota bacterium]
MTSRTARLAVLWLIGLGCPAHSAPARSAAGLCLDAADPEWTGDPAQEKTGSIAGTCQHSSVKKFPTLVFIDVMPGKEFKAPEKPTVMDQKNKEFNPRLLPILVGTSVEFINNDDFEHNVFSPDGEGYNLGNWGKGQKRSHTFNSPGVYVQLCKVHPEMVSYIVVLKTPYFAIADAEGKFKVPGVPAGTWKLKIWNERLKPKQLDATYEVKVEEGKEAEIEIKP